MIIDLHLHTRRYSGCSSIEIDHLLPRAAQCGLDGIVLTEHGKLWPEARLAEARAEAATYGLLLLCGQEVTCFHQGRRQDFLVYGLDESLGGFETPETLIELVHSRGGVVTAAHPFKPSRLGVGYHGAGDRVLDLDLDAIELQHPDHDEAAKAKVRAVAEKRGLPMTGGSDAHDLFQVGTYATRFERRIETIADLVAEIKAGRVTPVNGAGWR